MRFVDYRALAVPLLLLYACGGSEPAADPPAEEAAPPPYRAFVTNETSGDLTVIAGGTHEVLATIPLGKRPRGIKVDPAGERLFVALSGSPPAPAGDRRIDAAAARPVGGRHRHRRHRRRTGGDGAERGHRPRAGGGERRRHPGLRGETRMRPVASIVDIASGEILAQLPVGGEPEGVTRSPDGRWVYITSENDNQVTVIDHRGAGGGRGVRRRGPAPLVPRSRPDSTRAYVTAENGGTVSVVDNRRPTRSSRPSS